MKFELFVNIHKVYPTVLSTMEMARSCNTPIKIHHPLSSLSIKETYNLFKLSFDSNF